MGMQTTAAALLRKFRAATYVGKTAMIAGGMATLTGIAIIVGSVGVVFAPGKDIETSTVSETPLGSYIEFHTTHIPSAYQHLMATVVTWLICATVGAAITAATAYTVSNRRAAQHD